MDLPISAERPETLTQAYHAGILISMIENYLPNETIPPISICLVNFYALREVLGERIWLKLKTSARFAKRVQLYEKLTYQPLLPKAMIGTHRDFFLGYARSYEKSKLKKVVDRRRQTDSSVILHHLDR